MSEFCTPGHVIPWLLISASVIGLWLLALAADQGWFAHSPRPTTRFEPFTHEEHEWTPVGGANGFRILHCWCGAKHVLGVEQ